MISVFGSHLFTNLLVLRLALEICVSSCISLGISLLGVQQFEVVCCHFHAEILHKIRVPTDRVKILYLCRLST